MARVGSSPASASIVQTRTAFRFALMMSEMCGRRLFGACELERRLGRGARESALGREGDRQHVAGRGRRAEAAVLGEAGDEPDLRGVRRHAGEAVAPAARRRRLRRERLRSCGRRSRPRRARPSERESEASGPRGDCSRAADGPMEESPPCSRGQAISPGRLDEHELESDALRGNRLGDPHRRPLWVYAPPAYAASRTPLPVDLPDPGAHGPARHVAQPLGVPAERARARRRALRRRGLPARARRLRRRVDVVRRLAVPRLARCRQLPHVSLRRGRAVRRRALPHATRTPRTAASPASRAAATARW